MPALAGINGTGDGLITPASLRFLGARIERVVLLERFDLNDYLDDCFAHNIKVLGVCARESQVGTFNETAKFYRDRYGDKLDFIQTGNEADHESPSSWTLSQDDVNSLAAAFNMQFPQTKIIGPGLVSGDSGWIRGLDMQLFDAIAVHPYGQRPYGSAAEWSELPGNFGDVRELLDRYRAESHGLPLWITEIGVSTTECSREFQARYCGEMMRTLLGRSYVEAAIWFCMLDTMVPEFGLFDKDGEPKPAASAFIKAAGPMEPIPEPKPEPEPIPEPKPVPEPIPVQIPEQIYADIWRHQIPDADYDPNRDFEKYWKTHYGQLGPTVSRTERGSDDGGSYRAFRSGTVLRWTQQGGVEVLSV